MNKLIDQLNEKGLDTSWYKAKEIEPVAALPDKCSRLSLFLLKGEYSYTVKSNGLPFKQWKKLKEPRDTELYFCSGCKDNFDTWDLAIKHVDLQIQV